MCLAQLVARKIQFFFFGVIRFEFRVFQASNKSFSLIPSEMISGKNVINVKTVSVPVRQKGATH